MVDAGAMYVMQTVHGSDSCPLSTAQGCSPKIYARARCPGSKKILYRDFPMIGVARGHEGSRGVVYTTAALRACCDVCTRTLNVVVHPPASRVLFG